MKEIHFLSGLPRSGNTLLGSIINQNNKHDKNYSHNNNDIKKNQQEFGNKKRIKP